MGLYDVYRYGAALSFMLFRPHTGCWSFGVFPMSNQYVWFVCLSFLDGVSRVVTICLAKTSRSARVVDCLIGCINEQSLRVQSWHTRFHKLQKNE